MRYPKEDDLSCRHCPYQVRKDLIECFCQRNHIRKLAFFGSVLTDRFRPESDVDVLVEFHLHHVPGLLRLAGMERKLSAMLGRKVDIRTPKDLSRHFRDDVVASAAVQCESAWRFKPESYLRRRCGR